MTSRPVWGCQVSASRPSGSGPIRSARSTGSGPGGGTGAGDPARTGPGGPSGTSGSGSGPGGSGGGSGGGFVPGGPQDPATGPPPESEDSDLLAALLDGMDAALCAFDADGVVTHWNREAERVLGWSAEEAVGRRGFAGWAVRTADAEEIEQRLLDAMKAPGRQVHEFALLTKDGGRVLVRTQSAAVQSADGEPAGVYCAFSEAHAQIDLERSIALSEALFEDAGWGVVLVDADLRPAVVNKHALRAFGTARPALLGRPLGELLSDGVEELESALQHVLAEGTPPAPNEIWVTVRPASDSARQRGPEGARGRPGDDGGARPGGRPGAAGPGPDGTGPEEGGGGRRCWRCGFVRLASPLAEEPVPLGVGWFFQDVTEAKRLEQESSLLRFRGNQLHRAGLAAAECEDPREAAKAHLDFAMAGFADHVLLDLLPPARPDRTGPGDAAADTPYDDPAGGALGTRPGRAGEPGRGRLVRAAATPADSGGPCSAVRPGGMPVPYADGHPALQALDRTCAVRASAGGAAGEGWARARRWPDDAVHALCVPLRSRGRSLGVLTFLRAASRRAFERQDAVYAEDVAIRTAAALDLADAAGA
nr:PAS domain-containing protein [Streptomyces lycii]